MRTTIADIISDIRYGMRQIHLDNQPKKLNKKLKIYLNEIYSLPSSIR